ncbi:hypothetical protein PINS_up020870 [Pythium insidiosum]|nr:hypothetical protein PINS_up020870 [Pythium insidiosum]
MASLPPRHDVPHVQRHLSKAARVLTSDALEHARRQRQFETLVLSQIFERAERHRRQSLVQGKTPLGRAFDSDLGADDSARWRDERAPITLLELMQVAPVVLQKHGIVPPNDALFHRYLLSLSSDPTPDWRVKLLHFSSKNQPRVTRLCRTGMSRRPPSCQSSARQASAAPVAPLTPAAHEGHVVTEDEAAV